MCCNDSSFSCIIIPCLPYYVAAVYFYAGNGGSQHGQCQLDSLAENSSCIETVESCVPMGEYEGECSHSYLHYRKVQLLYFNVALALLE